MTQAAPSQTAEPDPYLDEPTPKAASKLAALLVSVAALALALAGLWAALFAADVTIWGSMGFMVVSIVAAVLGMLMGLGKFGRGFGIGLLCVAGTVGVAALFGWLDARVNLAGTPYGGRTLMIWLAAQGGVAGLLALTAALDVLTRSRASVALALKAAAVIAVLAVGAVLVQQFSGPLLTRATGAMEFLRLAGLLAIAIAALVLISAGGHLAIRAFEVAAERRVNRAEPRA